ncbi:hypothetical protein D3C81_2004770 [compost metagenome]
MLRVPVHIDPGFGHTGVGRYFCNYPLVVIQRIAGTIILFQLIKPLQHFRCHFVEFTGHAAFRLQQDWIT